MIWLILASVLLGGSIIGWVGAGVITFRRAGRRGGNKKHWFFYGLALGPFGLMLLDRIDRPCPGCGKSILREASHCPLCKTAIPRMKAEENPVDPFWSYRQNWSAADDKKSRKDT